MKNRIWILYKLVFQWCTEAVFGYKLVVEDEDEDEDDVESGCKRIVLKSSDGVSFLVDQALASESQTIKNMIEVDCSKSEIHLPNVTGKILSKLVNYWKKLVEDGDSKGVEEVSNSLNRDFIADSTAHFDLLAAAKYLQINVLFELGREAMTNMLKGKTTEQVRKILNIPVIPTADLKNPEFTKQLWIMFNEQVKRQKLKRQQLKRDGLA